MTPFARRTLCIAGAALMAATLPGTAPALAAPAASATAPTPMTVYDGIRTELALNLVVTCSDPEPTGGPEVKGPSKDGVRDEVWPIVDGRFWGTGPKGETIRGTVIAGGGDFPVVRPDGVAFVDALYRLRTDDGVIIVIHNKGIAYPPVGGNDAIYRTVPEFFAPAGKYDWLNKALFVGTLVWPVPAGLGVAKGPHENDRLIQVYRVL